MIRKLLFLIVIFHFTAAGQRDVPGWAEGVVWYQIFPERFANGDAGNDPEAEKVFINSSKKMPGWEITPWGMNWFGQQEWEKKAGGRFNNHLYQRRYGGDIQGIIDRLDYIKDLGIGAVYLNPMFEAVSLHKYDGSSYHHIDVNFGPDPEGDRKLIETEVPDDPSTWKWTEADKLFLKLVEEAHARGIKIVIDGVFNHTGVQFWAFKDVMEKGSSSKYAEWFLIKSFDNPDTDSSEFDYKGWWNIKSLPEFNRTDNDLHRGPKQYIFNSTARWMDPNGDGDPSEGIDGWRLDVARDVPIGFWKDWNPLVKEINPDAVIIGELWELSPDFVGDEGVFDALMNYNFAFTVTDFFIDKQEGIKASEFINSLGIIDTTYPEEYLNVLQNLMDSHDTERLVSLIANPDRHYDRDANESNLNYNPGKPGKEVYERQKLIAAFQMTYRGAPMVYYGDETGMWGADDPHDRKPMVWKDITYEDEVITKESGFQTGHGRYKVAPDEEMIAYYKKIINIRNNSEALKRGKLRFIYSNDVKGTAAFERNYGDERIIAFFNTGEETDRTDIKVEGRILYEELLSGEKGEAENIINIEAGGGKAAIYKIIKPD